MKTITCLLLVVGSVQAADDKGSCGGYFVQLADGSRIDDCTPKVKSPVMALAPVQPPPAALPAPASAPVELPAIDLHPTRMTNADVIRMVQGRVFTATILAAIHDTQPAFSFLPAQEAALSAAGVPDEVYRAMAARMEGPAFTPPPAAQNAFGSDNRPAQPAMSGWQKAATILDFAGRFVPRRYSVTIRHKR